MASDYRFLKVVSRNGTARQASIPVHRNEDMEPSRAARQVKFGGCDARLRPAFGAGQKRLMERTVWLRGGLAIAAARVYGTSHATPRDGPRAPKERPVFAFFSATPAGYPSREIANRIVAQVPGTVKEISVKGNKVQTTQGILATMRTKVGAQFNQATLDLDRETLFDLGVFKAEPNIVAIQNPDGTFSITVEVVENPVIKEIRVAGNTVFSRQQILAVTAIKP